MKKLLPAFALALLASQATHAVEYTQVQTDKSRIDFNYQQMGVKMDGRFKKFNAQLAFDPAKPAAAKTSLEIELASIDTGTPEADQEVIGKPWFNTKLFPSARFVSTGVKALGGNRYEVSGQLSIKGKTQEVVIPATLLAEFVTPSLSTASPAPEPLAQPTPAPAPPPRSQPATPTLAVADAALTVLTPLMPSPRAAAPAPRARCKAQRRARREGKFR